MISKFVRYIGTGGLAAIVDVSGFHVFLAVGMPIALAAGLSWFVAAFVNYYLTSRFVFNQAEGRTRLSQFLLGAACGFSVNVGVTLICASLIGISPTPSKVIGIGIAFVFNFLINLLWVFRIPPVDRGR
ncbi:GtrA family protein [Hyphomicrobium sp.]|jgi:putative flippase GtrA|uniref:GtrA family protein n=1 Tax=Hyphomicrobium sp. TaxID=82 RepID=UPI00356B370F